MKVLYLFAAVFIFLIWPVSLYAQNNGTIINGTVLTATGSPLSGATVTAYDSITNKPANNTLTDAKGKFSIQINAAKWYLYVTNVGFISYKISELGKGDLIIKLNLQNQELAEVTIKGQKPFIEQQFDRTVVNVEGSPKAGINATDVLKKIPGVAIINQDEIRLEGKSVTININGKPTHLSGNDLMNLLNSTATTSISQVEVLYNPSAKFDAQGDGGIINIKTLKRTKPGYDATLNVTGGHGWKYFSYNDVSAGLNYRYGNNYLFGNYSYDAGHQSQEIQTNTYLTGINQRLLDSTRYSTPYHGQNIRLGWDHYLNKTDILGVLVTGYNSHTNMSKNTVTGIYALGAPNNDSTRYSEDASRRQSKGININLNYKMVLDSIKREELTMDGDAGAFDYHNVNELALILRDKQGNAISPSQQIMENAHTLSHIYSYKADYTQKLFKGILESGIKASYVNLNNTFIAETGILGQPLSDNGSNDFLYKETILAAYVSTKQTIGKFTLQAGLRTEQTFTNGNSITLDSVVKRSYLALFPNFIAGYKFTAGLLSFSYSRRTGRPAYNYLNPFIIAQGAYSVFEGNPYLKPSFANNYRIGYSLHSKLSISATYSTVKDVITDLKLVDDATKVTTGLKANLDKNYNTGINIGYSDKLFNLINISYSGSVLYNRYLFNYMQAPVQVKQVTASISLDNQVNLPGDWWFDVYFYSQSRVSYGNQVNLPFSNTAISGGKKVLKGKGNISISTNDVFFASIQRSEAHYGNVDYDLKSKYDSRNIRINFSYRFGNSKVDVRNRTSGSAEEQRRNQ